MSNKREQIGGGSFGYASALALISQESFKFFDGFDVRLYGLLV